MKKNHTDSRHKKRVSEMTIAIDNLVSQLVRVEKSCVLEDRSEEMIYNASQSEKYEKNTVNK